MCLSPCRVWDDESKQKATAAAEQGGENICGEVEKNICHAAKQCGISHSTLHDHISGLHKLGCDDLVYLWKRNLLVSC